MFVFFNLILTQTAFCQNLQYNESNIKVYLNNIEIAGPIYAKESEMHLSFDGPPYSGFFSYDAIYIKLANIFPLIEAEINIRDNINERFRLLVESTDFTNEEQKNMLFNHIINILNERKYLIVINNEYYIYVLNLTGLFISISILPSNIGNNGISIYLRDFEY